MGSEATPYWKDPLFIGNLVLLVLFPVAWMAPLLKSGLLPFFDLDEISILTGLQSLFEKDIFLAIIVTLFALVAPMLKTAALVLVHLKFLGRRGMPVLSVLSKLAMADVFLVAVYIVTVKGVGLGRIETGWGLYLFTFCVIASNLLTFLTDRRLAR